MSNLTSYLTSTNIPFNSPFVTSGLIGSVVLFGIGLLVPLVLFFMSRKKKFEHDTSLLRALAQIMRVSGALWFILFGFRFEGISPFVARGWVYVVLVGVLIWSYVIIRRSMKQKPRLVAVASRNAAYTQYLPKKKVKK